MSAARNAVPERIDTATVEHRMRALCRGGVGPGLPRKTKDRWILLFAAARCVGDATLAEADLNARLHAWLEALGPRVVLDHVSLRRALVDDGFVARTPDGAAYRRASAYERRVVFEAAPPA